MKIVYKFQENYPQYSKYLIYMLIVKWQLMENSRIFWNILELFGAF